MLIKIYDWRSLRINSLNSKQNFHHEQKFFIITFYNKNYEFLRRYTNTKEK